MNTFLFVYGTLKNDAQNPMAEFLRANATFIGQGQMPGKVFDLGTYPGAVFIENQEEFVAGHIFEMRHPALVLSMLDEYEGIGNSYPPPQEYVRVERPVRFNQETVMCWVYLYNR